MRLIVWAAPIFFQICSLPLAYSQDDPIQRSANILPPSPTASELGKYGLIPVGLSTGAPNVNLPLHHFNVRSLALPVSLSYYSSGIKVDQIASLVGLGWSLNAGGVITRVVRDEPDDDNSSSPYPYPDVMNVTEVEAVKYIELAGSDGFDSERDLYSFNFLDYSGKFVFDRMGKPIVIPFQNIKIERYLTNGSSYYVISTPDGLIYTFSETETTRTINITPGCGKNYDVPAVTAWYLTKIENQLGDVIHLEYKSNTYSYKASLSQVLMKSLGPATCNGSPATCPADPNQTCITQLTIVGKTLSRIYSPNHGEIVFASAKTRVDVGDNRLDSIVIKNNFGKTIKRIALNYINSNSGSYFTNYLTTEELKYRMFLQSLEEHDAVDKKIRGHYFEYRNINALPPRLSFAQDHWGFFNGMENDYFVPSHLAAKDVWGQPLFPDVEGSREPNSTYSSFGMLTKITYPTGGHSELVYDGNTYWGTTMVYPSKTGVHLGVTGTEDRSAVTEQTSITNNPVQQDVLISAAANQNPYSQYPVDPIHNFATLKIFDVTANSYIVNERMSLGEHFRGYVTLLKNHSYTVSLTAIGEIVSASTSFDYYQSGPTEVTTNIPTGGVRVRSIVSSDVVKNTTEQTNYVYANILDLTKSSGKIGTTSQYYGVTTTRTACGGACGFYECRYGSLYSNSQISLYPVNGNNIYYQHVVVYKGPESNYSNGAEEHEFLIQFDEPGYIVTGEHIRSAPYTNFGWANGLEQAVRVYSYRDGLFKPIKETINNYVLDNRHNNAVGNLTVRHKYAPICESDAVVECNTSNVNRQSKRYSCTSSHAHHWVIGGWPLFGSGRSQCIAAGASNELIVVWNHPCYGRAVGETVIVQSRIDPLDAIEYKTIAYWFYNASITEKQYDNNGLNPAITVSEFYYDNAQHGLITRNKVTGSDGAARQTTHWYPQDYDDVGNLNLLRIRNLLNKPVKIEVSVAQNLIDGMVVEYTDSGLPKNVYKYRSAELVPAESHNPGQVVPSNAYELVGSLKYSASNNVTEVNSERSPTMAYIYDYFDSKPVAKVMNASESTVAYTSFESDGKGNWTFTGVPSDDIVCRTGNRYYKLADGNISRNVTAGKYKLEFWAKGTVSVTGGATLAYTSPPDPNGWVLYVYVIATAMDLTLELSGTASSYVDELRLYPHGAEMVTMTYDDGIGVTSETDSNNISTYYTHDDFGRVKYVKDSDGNVLRHFEYKYLLSQ